MKFECGSQWSQVTFNFLLPSKAFTDKPNDIQAWEGAWWFSDQAEICVTVEWSNTNTHLHSYVKAGCGILGMQFSPISHDLNLKI